MFVPENKALGTLGSLGKALVSCLDLAHRSEDSELCNTGLQSVIRRHEASGSPDFHIRCALRPRPGGSYLCLQPLVVS